MLKLASTAIGAAAAVAAMWTQVGAAATISTEGWTVTADASEGVLIVGHEKLGTLMQDVRLNLRGPSGWTALRHWSVEKTAPNQLAIATDRPRTMWLIGIARGALKVSSTSADAALTAILPASIDRMPVRLIDVQGVPVTWVGTDEVVRSGGIETRNASFLPRRNPDVMNFSLGLTSGSNLHELFDRKTDTAVEFVDQTVMRRSAADTGLLEATIPVPGNTVVRVLPDYFTQTLGVPYFEPFDDRFFKRPPMVWSSWTSYYDEVREADIVRNADWIAANLKPYGFEYVQLDDGYDRGPNGEHYWIERWNQKQFPHGPRWLADYIKSVGLHPGLWMVPNAYAGAVTQHPDWYLRDKAGNMVLDYSTPALDFTNPEVLDFLKREFRRLTDWGFEYYKFDGEYAITKYVPAIDRDRLHDQSIDPLAAYRKRLQVIRDAIGPGRFIEGCPAGTPLDAIGYFNSYFNGQDLYNSWQGMYALFSSINANAFLNRIVVYVMPGEGMELSPPRAVEEATDRRDRRVAETVRRREDPMMGFGTTLAEARTVVSYVALSGVAYPIASVMFELPDERVELLQRTLPTMPILPVDLYSRGTDMQWDTFKRTTPDTYIHNYPQILDLKVNSASGVYDVAALTNWRSEPVARELSIADTLGLSPGVPYVVFDFWRQKLLGVFVDRLTVEIEPHDTRVLFIRPALDRPQLIGISRHISGAYSILDLEWDQSRNQLHGASQGVEGKAYTLTVRVPPAMQVSRMTATAKRNGTLKVRHEVLGESVQVTFQGQRDVVDWTLTFVRKSGR
jgi:hypothetical protein